jgi:membrane protein YqaA with SNARE-associated domain
MGIRDPRLWLAGALIWGFAEATFFFIVPDLLLTAAVLVFGLSRAFRLSAAAALAAMAGGLLMMMWGASDAAAVRSFLLSVPLIGEDLLFRVHAEMEGLWPIDLTLGAITGAPFKIYAVEAGAAEINPLAFALTGFFARLARFSLAIGLTALGAAIAARLHLKRIVPLGLTLVWAAIYAVYVGTRLAA